MDILDRLLAHDAWTTRQLLSACETLPDERLDEEFDIDRRSLRLTFVHMIANMEVWTDLICERPVTPREGESIAELKVRLADISREFDNIAREIRRDQRYDACFVDTLDDPPRLKTFGGAIAHVITHNVHHRAQVMIMMERAGLGDHIEGDLLSWEAKAFGWV
ncbi:MAG: DinB family protein [Caldilineaceae bacterium]